MKRNPACQTTQIRMPVVITQTIRPQGMGLNVLVRLLPLYEFHCNYKLVAWEKLTVLTLAGLTFIFSFILAEECMFSLCSFKVFQTNTVKCFERTLGITLTCLAFTQQFFHGKVLKEVRNLTLIVLSSNSGPRKKFFIFFPEA